MKTKKLRFFSALLLCMVLGGGSAMAQKFTVDNIEYRLLSNGDALVTGYVNNGTPRRVNIPGTIYGHPVRETESEWDMYEYFEWSCFCMSWHADFPGVFENINTDTIDFGPGIEYIDRNTCRENTHIKHVIFGENVKEIGYGAFRKCYNTDGIVDLASLDSLKIIGAEAFYEFGEDGCNGDHILTLPPNLEEIGAKAFLECKFAGIVFNTNKLPLIQPKTFYKAVDRGNSALVLPNDTYIIEDEAFYNCHFRSVTTGEYLFYIGEKAFYQNTNLQQLTLNQHLDTIGEKAFAQCTSLTSVVCNATTPPYLCSNVFQNIGTNCVLTVPNGCYSAYFNSQWHDYFPIIVEASAPGEEFNYVFFKYRVNPDNTSVTIIGVADGMTVMPAQPFGGTATHNGVTYNVTAIGNYAFYQNSVLQNVFIQTPIVSIGNYAFANCSDLRSVSITGPVEWIGEGAFALNWRFPFEVNLPNSVSYIGDYAFELSQLTNVPFSASTQLEYIGKEAFYLSAMSGQLQLPNTLQYIGDKAFLTASDNLTGNLVIPNSVHYIGESAFFGCNFTGSLTIPNSVTYFGKSAFANCDGFTGQLVTPTSISNIPDNAFKGCTGITSWNGGYGHVRSIGKYAFSGCSSLTGTLYTGNDVRLIDQGAFYGCTGVDEIFVGIVDSIAPLAFMNCTGVTTVKSLLSIPNVSIDAFEGVPCTTLNVACGAEDDYSQTAWSYHFTTFDPAGCIEFDYEGVNYRQTGNGECKAIYPVSDANNFGGELYLPEPFFNYFGDYYEVTKIDDGAFWGYHLLSGTLTIPSTVKRIGNFAFRSCTGYAGQTLILGQSVEFIGEEAFHNTGFSVVYSLNDEAPNLDYDAFDYDPNAVLIVPCGSLESYLTPYYGWTNYFDIIIEECGTFIGDGGNTTNIYYPSTSLYNYSLTQQIYTADEIGPGGQIYSVSFFNDGSTKTRNYDIYLVNTDKTAFESENDWIAVTSADLVFSGTVTMTSGKWTTCVFNRLFDYNAGSNLALIIDDNTGDWNSAMACLVFDANDNQAIFVRSDGTNYNPTSPSGYNGTRMSVKNQIILGLHSNTSSFDISATANPTEGGTVTGGGTYNQGASCTLTATANEGYVFVNWTKDGNEVSTNATYSFEVTEDAEYVANFSLGVYIGDGNTTTDANLPSSSMYNYSLTEQIYTADELGGGGTISSLAFYNSSSEKTRSYNVYMVHTAKTAFENMSDWIAVTPSDRVFSGSVTLIANGWTWVNFDTPFPYDGTSNIAVVVEDQTGDTGNGKNEMACLVFDADGTQAIRIYGDEAAFDPTAPAYNGVLMGVKNQIQIEFTNEPIITYSITATTDPTEGGTVAGAGTYQSGQLCTLTATANAGYTFTNWTQGGTVVSNAQTYTFTVTEDAAFVANFRQNVCTVTVAANPTAGGTAIQSGNGTYNYGTAITLTATANTGYTFLYWTANDAMLSTNPVCTLTVTGDTYCVARFVLDDATVQVTPFTSGWNWYSTYIEQGGIDGLAQLEGSLGANGIQIKSQGQYLNYYEGMGWMGMLSSVNNESSYKIKTSAACVVEMTGEATTSASHPITIGLGWNWIGYPVNSSMSVGTALSGITPANGDQLKALNGYANYYNGMGWMGTLSTLEPGMGLLYKSNGSGSFTLVYPEGAKGETLVENISSDNNHWVPDTHAYPDNMTVTAIVKLDDEELTSDSYELAAFANGECRGSVRLMYIEPLDRYIAFLTITGEEVETLSFSLYDMVTGEEVQGANEQINFSNNATLGDLMEPYAVHFRDATSIDEWAHNLYVYPNPVAKGQLFSLVSTKDEIGEMQIEIINALGVVETIRTTTAQTIAAPDVAGVYTLRITVEGKGTCYRKLVVR